ncbi:FMRFamide receptor-like [Tubulanus polymorphus]|uniref:FMRFamide receptor-like n=1 Tax=Tubulanus polymorphus TaxID=672921 RepID=UPI003DA5A732
MAAELQFEEAKAFYAYNTSDGRFVNSTCPPNPPADVADYFRETVLSMYPGLVLFNFVIETVFVGLLCAIGFVGNLLSFIVLWKDRSQSTTNFLLQALAIADTLLLIDCIMVMTLRSIYPYLGILKSYYQSMPYMMPYLWPFAMMAQTITNWLVILVTIERYIVVCKPLRAMRWCTKQKAKRGVTLVFILAIIYSIPRFFEFKVIVFTNICANNQTYALREDTSLRINPIFNISYRIILYFLLIAVGPVVILVILNFKLIRALHKAQRERIILTRSRSTKGQQSQAGNTTVIVAVVTQFIICQMPALVHQVLEWSHLPINHTAQSYSVAVSNMLVAFNSSTNFFIYCLFGRKFRSILIRLLCGSTSKSSFVSRHFNSLTHHSMSIYKAEFSAVSQVENGECV